MPTETTVQRARTVIVRRMGSRYLVSPQRRNRLPSSALSLPVGVAGLVAGIASVTTSTNAGMRPQL